MAGSVVPRVMIAAAKKTPREKPTDESLRESATHRLKVVVIVLSRFQTPK